MRRGFLALALVLFWSVTGSARAQDIRGSGSSFCFPLIVQWAESFAKATGAKVKYNPIGSALGITEIRHDVVDFAVSDAPLDDAQLLRDGLIQFPVAIGGIVPFVNLESIRPGQLRFDGPLLAAIFLGKVTRWNDPAIVALNPDVKLPDLAILVVHRTDGSGTTFNWASYLSSVSNEWKVKVGANTLLSWPAGVGGKGNGGVAEKVARVRGAIGYIDYTYAARQKLTHALVRNQAGNFVGPAQESFMAATANVDWTKNRDFYVLLTDAGAADAYPIMATSFAMIRKNQSDPARVHSTLSFFRWALEHEGEAASPLGYLALPPVLVQQVVAYWSSEGR